MQEVSGEEQAAMALKLADDVRKMIRKEIRAALEDPAFMAEISNIHPLNYTVFQFASSNAQFISAVKAVVSNQMNKY